MKRRPVHNMKKAHKQTDWLTDSTASICERGDGRLTRAIDNKLAFAKQHPRVSSPFAHRPRLAKGQLALHIMRKEQSVATDMLLI